MSSYRSKDERAESVSAWRASGKSAAAFARSLDVSVSSLQRWATEAKKDQARGPIVAFARVSVVPQAAPSSIVVEVGQARLAVQRGFDAALLRQIVSALSSEAS